MRVGRREFLASLAGVATVTGSNEAAYSYDPVSWQRVRDGLEFSRLGIYANGRNVDTLAVIRADPERNRFRLFYDRRQRRTVEDWQKYTEADAVFNAGFYMYDNREPYGFATEHTALIIIDGYVSGHKNNKRVRGMFVSEPKNGKKPYAKIIDMDHERGYDQFAWDTGLQSWPMLIHSDGRLGTSPGSKRDSRTAVCEDESGRILAVTTEDNNLTLYDFARALRNSELGIKRALNLDGGHAAQMSVKVADVNYSVYAKDSDFETPPLNAFMRNVKVPIPGVIGIFPRS